MKLLTGLFLGALSSLVFAVPSLAQKFTISPLVTVNSIRNGQSKGSITVTNNGKEPLRMRAYVENFNYDRVKGFTITGNHDRSIAPYLQFSPRELVIPPGVSRTIRVSVALPANLPNGEYRAVVFLEDLKERETTQSGNKVLIKTRVASVFFIGKGNTQVTIQADNAMWDNTSKKLFLVMANRGSRTAFPNVDWEISQAGRKLYNGQIRGILLQSDREREVPLTIDGKELSLPAGNYELSGSVITGESPNPTINPFKLKLAIPQL